MSAIADNDDIIAMIIVPMTYLQVVEQLARCLMVRLYRYEVIMVEKFA